MKRLLPLFVLVLCLTGCRTAVPPLDYRALVRAADRLGVDIGPKDHHALYLEAAQWIGTLPGSRAVDRHALPQRWTEPQGHGLFGLRAPSL